MSRKWSNQSQKSQGSTWPSWSPQWPQKKNKGGKADKKDGEDPGGKSKDALPLTYSSMQVSGGQAVEDQGAQAFMNAFMKIVQDGKTEVPEVLQPFMPDPEREGLRSQQRKLNKLRSVKQKIQSKEKALGRDEQQWRKWLEEVKIVIEQQHAQHQETQERLARELQELHLEEENLKKEKDHEQMEISDEDTESREEKVVSLVDSLMAAPTKPAKTNRASPPVTSADAQDMLQVKVEEMQAKLQADFQQRLKVAESALEQRYAMKSQQEIEQIRSTMMAAPVVKPTSQVVDLVNDLDALDGATMGNQNYGADRRKTKTENSPYRKDGEGKTPLVSAETMEQKLSRSHGQEVHE